ncbi:hypothetical protein DMENIID0001_147120 [Sergentomyia squamirostris]
MLRFHQPDTFSPTIPPTSSSSCVRFVKFSEDNRKGSPSLPSSANRSTSNGATVELGSKRTQFKHINLSEDYPVSLSFATEWLV